MVVDFWRKPTPIIPVNIHSLDIRVADSYKYLGVHLKSRLEWFDYWSKAMYKKGQSWLLGLFDRAGHYWGLFMTWWGLLQFFMQFSAGEVAARRGTRKQLNTLMKRASFVMASPLAAVLDGPPFLCMYYHSHCTFYTYILFCCLISVVWLLVYISVCVYSTFSTKMF